MKRNEVVKLIMEYFTEAGVDLNVASDSANELLDELENRVEMLPPKVCLHSTGDYITKQELLNFYEIDGNFQWEE